MNDKLIFRFIYSISALVFILVVVLNRKVLPAPEFIPQFAYMLPKFNAFINGTCSILLLVSFYFIRKKNIAMHKLINIITFAMSSVFLVSYVLFHYYVKETHFGGEGIIKNIYYIILISHIILAAVVLPLILFSFHRGLQMQVELHKKLVRWTYPIWLYVTVSGVVVYLMISPYYQF